MKHELIFGEKVDNTGERVSKIASWDPIIELFNCESGLFLKLPTICRKSI